MKIEILPSGKGIADVVFVPKKTSSLPAILVELKWDKSSSGALAQIKEKKYPAVLKNYDKSLVLVGINYNKVTKLHSCKIENVR